jgi:tetratricopeptide (TPR) repeat protein
VAAPFDSVRLHDIEPIPVAGGLGWLPLRRTLGVEAFGINAYVAGAAGEPVVEEHTEENLGHEEVYVVLTGRATFTLDGETLDAPAGTAVFVREPTVRRGAVAAEPATSVLAIGGKAGESYSPSAWEWYFAAERYRESADYDGALTLLGEGLERFPDHAGMLYSMACWESLAGRSDAAVEHLRRALELDTRFVDWSKTDADLDNIRGVPGYPGP